MPRCARSIQSYAAETCARGGAAGGRRTTGCRRGGVATGTPDPGPASRTAPVSGSRITAAAGGTPPARDDPRQRPCQRGASPPPRRIRPRRPGAPRSSAPPRNAIAVEERPLERRHAGRIDPDRTWMAAASRPRPPPRTPRPRGPASCRRRPPRAEGSSTTLRGIFLTRRLQPSSTPVAADQGTSRGRTRTGGSGGWRTAATSRSRSCRPPLPGRPRTGQDCWSASAVRTTPSAVTIVSETSLHRSGRERGCRRRGRLRG